MRYLSFDLTTKVTTVDSRKVTAMILTTFINYLIKNIRKNKNKVNRLCYNKKSNKLPLLVFERLTKKDDLQIIIKKQMNNYIYTQIKPTSKSMQISKQRTNRFKFKNKVFVVKDIREHSQKDVKQIKISPLHHLPTDNSKSSDIAIIKQQIQKLRTQSPQLNYTPQDRSLIFLKGQPKSKKRDDLVKIVMNKLKRQKSKEYARKLKKNDVLLPKLDLSGKSLLQTPNNIKYAPYIVSKIPELDINKTHWLQDSVVQKKQVQSTTKKPYVFKSQLSHNKHNQSISGWHKNSNPEEQHYLFIDN